MKSKLFTLLLAVAASVGTMFAWDYERVQIGDMYYNLDATNQTAQVTYQLEWDANNYSGLTTAIIPASVNYSDVAYSVTSIGNYAFVGCSGLTSVTIPNSVTSIGDDAFYYCAGLTKVNITDIAAWCNITFSSYSSNPLGYAKHLYVNDTEVTNLTIPNSVTSIGSSAFKDCSGLTSVTIPNSVTSIGQSAFYECSGLTSVTIPNSVTSIGEGAFAACTGLTSLSVEAGNTVYDSRNNCNAIVETLTNTLIVGCKTSIIPNSVTSIGNYAFYYCTGLTSVTIPNSVTSIGDRAFYGCSGLTSVIWNAKNYADFASNNTPFYYSRSQITSFTFGNEVEHIPANLCNGMSNLTSVTIPNSVTSIGRGAFSGCSGLTSVIWNAKNCADFGYNTALFDNISSQITSFTFGNEVEHIPAYLCNGMSNLTSVTIGNSVTSIGDMAFYECTGLTKVNITDIAAWCAISFRSFDTNPLYYARNLYLNETLVTDLIIPNDVTSIGGRAFEYCSGLTSVTIPNSVTSIGNYAFSECPGLTSVEAPAGFFDIPEGRWPSYTKILSQVTVNGGELTENALLFINRSYKTLQTLDVSGVTNTEFADEAFKGYYNLQQLVLPEGLQKVGYMMVAGCKNLQSIDIPASVEEIEQSAFEDCRSIQSITFGGSSAGAPGRFNAPAASASQLRRIGNWAFYNAHELQHLDIPEGVTEIGDGAFYGCTYLEEMVLPSSVQSIGDNCFALCAKLTKITCNAVTPPTIEAKTFFDVKRQIPVYVPDEAVASYEGDTYWQEFDIQGISHMPQGVDQVQRDQVQSTKILHNGQIFILRGEKVYTVDGRLVR